MTASQGQTKVWLFSRMSWGDVNTAAAMFSNLIAQDLVLESKPDKCSGLNEGSGFRRHEQSPRSSPCSEAIPTFKKSVNSSS